MNGPAFAEEFTLEMLPEQRSGMRVPEPVSGSFHDLLLTAGS
jgi:hypothetical protein